MLDNIKFYIPTKVIFGENSLNASLQDACAFGKNALIVAGRKFARSTGLIDLICEVLKNNNINFDVLEGVSPEPAIDDCIRAAEAGKTCGADFIIAAGGGSVMDVSKAAAVLIKNPGRLQDYFGEEKFRNDPVPVIAIPTTCGSGSEVTRYAVIIDQEAGTKKTVSSERIIPKMAILDPALLKSLPGPLIAGTGMDALCHAIEGFLSKKANHLTKIFSRESINLIINNIVDGSRQSFQSMEKVFLGSLYAGFVINHTGTIFIHGMAYGLTIKYRISHGLANAICLPSALEFLKTHGYDQEIEEIEKIFKIGSIHDIYKQIQIPVKLRDIGVKEGDIDVLSEMAVKGCERAFKNMKTSFGLKDFAEIFRSIL